MDIRFNCPRCSQNLSVDESGAGMTVSCPNCKEQIEIPVQSTLPPRLPVSPQPQQAALRSQAPVVKGTKFPTKTTFGAIVAIGLAAVLAWCVHDSSKPELFAKVQVTPNVLRVTNGNDTGWNSPTIILNDGFGGPILDIAGVWPPNETRELPLSNFRGRFNHQPFNPNYEQVRQVIIQAHGFQLATYTTHR